MPGTPENSGPDVIDAEFTVDDDQAAAEAARKGNGHLPEGAAIDAAQRVIDSNLDLGLDAEDGEGEDVVDTSVEVPAPAEKKASWAARAAKSLGEKAVNTEALAQAPADGEDMNRRQKWYQKGQERLRAAGSWVSEKYQAARATFVERVGTWEEIKDMAKAARGLGKNLVKVSPGIAMGALESAGSLGLRKTQNAGNRVAEAHHTVIGAGHEGVGFVLDKRTARATQMRTDAESHAKSQADAGRERRTAMGTEGTGFWKTIGHALKAVRHEGAASQLSQTAEEWKTIEEKRKAAAAKRASDATARYGKASSHSAKADARNGRSGTPAAPEART